MTPQGSPGGDAETPEPADEEPRREPRDIDVLLAEMQRGSTKWPTAHRHAFEEVVEKFRQALEEVHVTEEQLREQNEELAAAQLEAVVTKERYAELFNFAPAAQIVTDLNGTIIEANALAAAMFGVAQKNLFGKPLPSFVPPAARRKLRAKLARIASEGGASDWLLRLKPRDGPAFDASAIVGVFRDADGARTELRWILQDVTELEEAKAVTGRDLELYRLAVETASDLITVIDPEGRVMLASPSWRTTLGYDPDRVTGQNFFDVLHPDDLADASTGLEQTMTSGEEFVGHLRLRHEDGRWVEFETSGNALRDEHEVLMGAVMASRDVSERMRLERRAEIASVRYRKLQSVTDVLLRHIDLDELLPELLEAVRQAIGSATATLLLPTPDGQNLAIRAVVGEEEGRIGEIRVPLGEGVAGRVAAERTPRIVPDLRKARPHSEFLRRRLRSLVAVPLVIDENTVGVVHAGTFDLHEFTQEDVTLLQLVAERAAVAIQNLRLYESARDAQRAAERYATQTTVLQAVTAALSEALSTERVAEVVVDRGVPAAGAIAGLLALVTEDRSELEITRSMGYPQELLSEWQRFPVDADLPLSEAVRSGQPVLLDTTAAREKRYPHLRATLNVGDHAIAAIPISMEGRALGGLVFRFPGPRGFDDSDVAFMLALARQAALALERTRLYESERKARSQAEVAQVRLAFLAEAGAILARSLHMRESLENLGRLAVTFLSDLCLIDLLDEDGNIRRMVAVHADAEKQNPTDLLRTRYAPDPEGHHPAARVIKTGRSEFSAEMPEDFLRRITRSDEHFQILRELGVQSYMCVPLLSRGRVLGCFTLVSTNPARTYGQTDVELGEELARRAALSIDNALLYQAEHQTRRAAERATDRMSFLAEASHALSTSLDLHALLQQLANLAVPRLADWCLVDLLRPDGSLEQPVIAHRDSSKEPLIRELRERYPPQKDRPHPVWSVLLSGQSILAEDITETELASRSRNEPHLELLKRIGIRSHVVVPLTARGRILGALSFIRGEDDRRYGSEDLLLAEDLARRAALVVDNARLYERQLHIAQTLQRSLLPPSIPAIPGMELAARYRAAGEGTEVGGDFYDAFETADGAWIITIGDVCGKGPEAAAVTGLARHTIRAVSIHEPRPSHLLSMLNETILRELSDDRFCTVCCIRVRGRSSGARLTICSGGHPLPVIIRADGAVETAGEPSMLLGVLPGVELSDHVVELAPGDTIVMYTDGVVEEFRDSTISGPDRLAEVLASCKGLSAKAVADAVESSLTRYSGRTFRDDFAVLALRVSPDRV